MLIASPETLKQAVAHLEQSDLRLAKIIHQVGPCTITPHTNYYWELVSSIISQQLSVKAAATIERRFLALFNDTIPSPEAILQKDSNELRTVGLSRAKSGYIQDLAQHIIGGHVVFDKLESQSNKEIIAELTAVKGIGDWTVHMFLMFCMGRLDILASGDLGIRSSIQKTYHLAKLPKPSQVADIAKQYHWQPYETVACWYLWQSVDT